MLNRPDGIVNLTVDAEEHLKNVLGNFFVFKQVLLRALRYVDSLRIIAHMLGNRSYRKGSCSTRRATGKVRTALSLGGFRSGFGTH